MANLIQVVAFEIKAGQSASGIIDLTQYAPRSLYPMRIPDGGHLMPVGAPATNEPTPRGGGALDFYPIGDADAIRVLRCATWQGAHGETPVLMPLAEWWATIPHLVLLAVDENGDVVAQTEDTVIYANCEVRR